MWALYWLGSQQPGKKPISKEAISAFAQFCCETHGQRKAKAFPPRDIFQPLAMSFIILESFPFPSIFHVALIFLKDADFCFAYNVRVPPHETMNPTSQLGFG